MRDPAHVKNKSFWGERGNTQSFEIKPTNLPLSLLGVLSLLGILSLLGGFGLAGLGLDGFTSAAGELALGGSGTPPIPSRSPIGAGWSLSINEALSLPFIGRRKRKMFRI